MGKELNAEEMLEIIFNYMGKLAVSRDINKSLDLLAQLGKAMVNADRASLWYWDRDGHTYWTLTAMCEDRIEIPEGSGIVGACINSGNTIIINNPYEDDRFNPSVDRETGYVTKSIVCVPVINDSSEVIGAYQVINKLDGTEGVDGSDNACEICGFTERDVKLLSLAAGYSGEILESYILRQEGMKDQLTGLYNRKGFYDYYDNKIIENNLDGAGIIMGDIDFFKKVNDTYGHNAGDAVLRHVADILAKNVRNCGMAFRWGGEEFIMLVNSSDKENVLNIAETIRKEIEDTVCVYEGTSIKMTISMGVSFIKLANSADWNVSEADELLYEAKEGGRNRVVSHGR